MIPGLEVLRELRSVVQAGALVDGFHKSYTAFRGKYQPRYLGSNLQYLTWGIVDKL